MCSGDAGQSESVMTACGASRLPTVCNQVSFCMLAFSLCKAAIFTLSLNTDWHAAAVAMADLEALSALSAALATTSAAAALISLLE